MEQVKHIRLQDGVYLTTVHTAKFKSSRFGVKFLMPLDPEHASEYALLPWVLRRGSQAHPDMACLSAALDELYGGVIEPDVTKKGETQCIGFAASFLDDAYALEGEALLDRGDSHSRRGRWLGSSSGKKGGAAQGWGYAEAERGRCTERVKLLE